MEASIVKVHDNDSAKTFKSAKIATRLDKRTIKILPERLYEASITTAIKMIQKRPSTYRRLGEEYYMFETQSEVFFGESVWGKQLYEFLQTEGITHKPVKTKFMRTRREGKRYYVCLAESVDAS